MFRRINSVFDLKRILFAFCFVFLCLPFIQLEFHPFNLEPLSGAYIKAEDTLLTPHSWLSGRFQQKEEAFIKDSFGLRQFFIRANNELNFDLFSRPQTADVIIGKNGELFTFTYLDEFAGKDYIGEKRLQNYAETIKKIQNWCDSMHKVFLLVLAPSKAYYYPENNPDNYAPSNTTNYYVFSKIVKDKGINTIDFNSLFIKLKKTAKYPLYPHVGCHWSDYGACIAADSIVSYLENALHVKMSHTDYKKIELSEAREGELELEHEMNLMFPLKREYLAHPAIVCKDDSSFKRPNLLYVGDSYFWNMAVHYNLWSSFRNLTFLYYFKTAYGNNLGGLNEKPVDQLNLGKQIKSADIIILEATTTGLHNIGWGFPEVALALKNDSTGSKISEVINKIKADANWFNSVKEKAKVRNMGIDSALYYDAVWVIEHANNNK